MPPQQPAPEEEGRLWRAVKMAAMVVGGQIVVKQLLAQFAPQPPPAAAVVGVQQHVPQASLTPDHAAAAAAAAASDLASLPLDVTPHWPAGTALTLEIYTSTSPSAPVSPPRESPLVAFTNLTYGAWADQSRFADVYVDIPEAVISHNASLFADMFLRSTTTTTDEVTHVRHPLVKYMPPRKVRKEVSLLGNSSTVDSPEDDATPPGVIPHFSPNLTLALVVDSGTLKYRAQPAPIRSHIHLVAPGNRTYYPILYPNEFWHLQDSLIALNASSRSARLPLRVTCDPQAMWKFNLYAHMNMAFEQQAQAKAAGAATGPMGSAGGADLDELKKMLISANPYWLAITIVVTLLHTLFEFLAFSSDVSHWRKKDKDLVGVSLRTIITNVVVQLIILLYLHDSSEETSFMILASQGIGLLVEAWKITKVVDIKLLPAPAGSVMPYKLSIEDKHELTDDEKKTQEYDRLAFKLVGYAAAPLMAGYTYYSLNYKTHKGWYSFVITTLAQAIYMFGFAQLVPQLIINYKLKSVAHMPMKAMVYKTLTTIVDDCASFVIHMPWLHRLACFRDDVVFLILLYQRWIYRIDPTRANEYGQVLQGETEVVGDVAAGADKGSLKAGSKEKVGKKAGKDGKGRNHLKTE